MVTSEMQSCMKNLQDAAKKFTTALEDAKRAGLYVTIEPQGQGVSVKCGPPVPAHDHDDGGAPLLGSPE